MSPPPSPARAVAAAPVVLSCFDLTTTLIQPWAEAGYRCYCVDLQHPPGETRDGNIIRVGADVREWLPPYAPVAFAAFCPPCTNTAISGRAHCRHLGLPHLAGLCRLAPKQQRHLQETPLGQKPAATASPEGGGASPQGRRGVPDIIGFCKRDSVFIGVEGTQD